ncbi:uncharacterized protein LOC135708648 [Ochlerotatus camptorhynchus]|uniref:uncharacterized protein LOC135708648 n=1 Tax=Ochlerotatus camptorhynchus TaxID=644619 RepID=UPI0031DB9E71
MGILSRKVSCPTELDWNEAKRIVRFLIHTMDYGLKLDGSTRDVEQNLEGYCDADWAGDTIDRKSASGYLFRLEEATISWTSRKQSSVTTSTMDAEYVALLEATQYAVFLRRLNLKQTRATVIHQDNKGCMDFVAFEDRIRRNRAAVLSVQG